MYELAKEIGEDELSCLDRLPVVFEVNIKHDPRCLIITTRHPAIEILDDCGAVTLRVGDEGSTLHAETVKTYAKTVFPAPARQRNHHGD